MAHAANHSDIFVFSHGWNNDWSTATQRYESFIKGFQAQRRSLNLPMPAGYKPLLVGVFWPSQALEWFDSETGPGFAAGGDPAEQDAAVEASRRMLNDIATRLAAENRSRFFTLAQAERLSGSEAREFASLLLSTGEASADDDAGPSASVTESDMLASAAAFGEPEPDYDAVHGFSPQQGAPSASAGSLPQAALGLGDVLQALDPRQILKPFTVWQMKNRAGKVGGRGVAALLEGLRRQSKARIHLLGHSFGCKVVMTAVCSLPEDLGADDGQPPVTSAVLLQPAVSQYAFAPRVPGREPAVAGGFVKALQRVQRPIVTTFSDHDVALTKLFHLALRRQSDLGEDLNIAAGGPPSKYAALGGYGPQDSGAAITDILDPGQAYDFGSARLVGVRGTRTISGHGDISNASTWWLAYAVAASA
ncbi:hypothetical protein [Azohydromonas australica]|uniref:hypothetical protein n=1 Tax=Azohydromonas australica TaxID=364039 RepID=UPI0012EBD74C|nr:hypothetical protein [Azohydromonas australica]